MPAANSYRVRQVDSVTTANFHDFPQIVFKSSSSSAMALNDNSSSIAPARLTLGLPQYQYPSCGVTVVTTHVGKLVAG